ncbi:MAG: hypothetical protein II625_02525 [Bacilli bacterium]|nr:hypothetical protein [Bacilli bacterium]
MDQEVKRLKYRYLLNSLQRIRTKISNLEVDSVGLYNYVNSSFKVDDKCVEKERFDSIKDNFVNIKSELREKLIYSVSRKI